MRYYLLWLILLARLFLSGQVFLEDFEASNLNNWEVITGIADLATDPIIEGNQSLRLWNLETLSWPEAIIRHKTFNEDFGVYSYYARADGEQSDADFYFHFIDIDNYYQISHKPRGTDNPEFIITKVVDGILTELHRQDAIEDRGRWIFVRIERYCQGRLAIGVNNNEVLDIIDTDILSPGSIGFRSWNQFSYFDRIDFAPSITRAIDIDATICLGQVYQVGNNSYDSSGTYLDTIRSSVGCDSIIQLELEIVERLETQIDTTICLGTVIELVDRTIDSEDSFSLEFTTSEGCDSIVFWNVNITPEFDLGPNRGICDEKNIEISAGNQLFYIWTDGSTNSTLNIEQQGTYGIKIIDINNCMQSDSITVFNQCELKIYAPTVFTPNGDALHDSWKPSFDILPDTYTISIYDRWGNLQFYSEDPEASWDGNFKNLNAKSDVYVWHIIANAQSFTGDITILR